MNILIIGGVAAGTKAAAKLKRADRSAEVTLITKDHNISYAGCGLPYYIGGLIAEKEDLIVNTPQKFEALTGVHVLTGRNAVSIDCSNKKVTAENVETKETETYCYDKLIIATGASPVVPPVKGVSLKGVFKLRVPEDAIESRAYIQEKAIKKAVVIGGGFIGLEAADNLREQGLDVTVIDYAPQILPNVFDPEMAGYVKKHLRERGIRVITGVKAEAILGEKEVTAVQTSAGTLPAGIVILSVGIRPNTQFLEGSGIELYKGTILTNRYLETNIADIYAAGDCAMVTHRITGKPFWSPMGSSANMEGRSLAQTISGTPKPYPGVLGTGAVKLPGLNCGRTGLTEAAAKDAGYRVETVTVVTDDKAHYYPDASFFITKLIADRETHQLLGIQVLGPGAVDKMTDIAVTGISMGAKLEDYDNLDFTYAPPFSTAIHPFLQAVYVLLNKLNGDFVSMTPSEYLNGAAEGWRIIDTNPQPVISGATYVDLTKVNGPLDGIGKEEQLLIVCTRGKRAYFLQNRLRYYGYQKTKVLEGGVTFNDVRTAGAASVTEEEITRVKALGFLQDKNTPDRFNARVITRNGKISAEENRAITEAAELYGNGEITMTSRLTIEIQGVPFENIEPLREYLSNAGLDTGGTGSKVRPVVSCKGTTCQYGLIDTFALSEEIHERFYKGYRNVLLPHKFKIAVGGCPNNCVKPDLNDLGVIGQRVPEIDFEKCRGCKICGVEKICPMKAAQVIGDKIKIQEESCNNCGRCIEKCPFHAVDRYIGGYRIYIGGRWGKKIARGRALDKIFTEKEEVLDTIEKAILLFREQGITGERFSDTIERLGFENVQAQLLSADLLQRKEENLKMQKHLKGGATC